VKQILVSGPALLFVAALAGCAAEEQEIILAEPSRATDVMEAAPVLPCEPGDDDGIGGTGCEPLE